MKVCVLTGVRAALFADLFAGLRMLRLLEDDRI